MQIDAAADKARRERAQRLKIKKEEYWRDVSESVDHYKSLLAGPHSQRIYEILRYEAYGLPSMHSDPDYWQMTYPELLRGGVPPAHPQLLDANYWIKAYTYIQAPNATKDDVRVLRKFFRASMALINQADKVEVSDVFKVLQNDLSRNTLFHLVFCISRIIESTLDLQSFRARVERIKPKATGTADLGADDPVKPDNSETLMEKGQMLDSTMKVVSAAGMKRKQDEAGIRTPEIDDVFSAANMLIKTSETLMEMNLPSKLAGQEVLTTGTKHKQDEAGIRTSEIDDDDDILSGLVNTICLILKGILEKSGAPLVHSDSRSPVMSIVKDGVSFLIFNMKKEQVLLNELLTGACADSSWSQAKWEDFVSTCRSDMRMLKEISWSELRRSVHFLNNAYPDAHLIFQMIINPFDPLLLWPDVLLSTAGLPEGAQAGNSSATGLDGAAKIQLIAKRGYFRMLFGRLEKEGAL